MEPRSPHSRDLRTHRVSRPYGLYLVTPCLQKALTLTDTQRTDLAEALQHGRRRAWIRLHAFVVMPNHWHGLLSLGDSLGLAETIWRLHRRASFPSRQYGTGITWQAGYHEHQVRPGRSIHRIVRYIEANPVRKGWVGQPGDWPWSSANPEFTGRLDREFLGWERWVETE